ncbi:hypothetical protein DY000_02037894 [Brassica cretica]|uniref:Uncharacterized protein n=1 Tax=Brassica cretica TaxID=69181 RepID=A0ABQ7BLU3_BRACR|nr:hypothetical protein DY000_02037894 [Brassica cretica]
MDLTGDVPTSLCLGRSGSRKLSTGCWAQSGYATSLRKVALVFHHMVLIFHSFKGFFQIWKTSGTTYLLDVWYDLYVSCLKYNALDDFQEVVQTTFRKSSGLPGIV